MNDSTVVVAGAGNGIGRAVATAFAERDWTVVVGAETAEALTETVAACEDVGATATGIRANVRDEFDLERLARTGTSAGSSSGIDAVVPAGDVRHGDPGSSPIGEDSYAAFDDHWRANARGVFATIVESLPHLNPGARILVPTTDSAHEAVPGTGSYAISRAGGEAVARSFAVDTDYAVGCVDPLHPESVRDGGEPDGSLFVWAATDLDAATLDGATITRTDRDGTSNGS